jgi:hypothetical protein
VFGVLQPACLSAIAGSQVDPSTCASCICPSGQLPAYNGNIWAACVSSCGGAYPVVCRSVVNTGTIKFCSALAGPCPDCEPFPYYAAPAAGEPAVLVQCTPRPADCSASDNFVRPVPDSDLVMAGCLDASPATTVCPIAYDYTTMAMDGATFKACLKLGAGQPCPATYGVFTTTSLPYPGTMPAMCLVPGITACPLDFPFQLLDNAAIQGCLPQQASITTCNIPAYQNWRGVAIGSSTNELLGCATTATTTCPSGYIPLWDTSVTPPAIRLCRPQLSYNLFKHAHVNPSMDRHTLLTRAMS